MHHIQGCEKKCTWEEYFLWQKLSRNNKIRTQIQPTNKQTKVQLQLLHQQNKTTSFQTLKTLHSDKKTKKKKKKKKKSGFGTGEREITGVLNSVKDPN
jgi:hypothetical protein